MTRKCRWVGAALTVGLAAVMMLAGCGGPSVDFDPPPPQPVPQGEAKKVNALWSAAQSCDQANVQALIKAGADVNAAWGPRQTTPLMEAVSSYDSYCVPQTTKILVLAGAELDKRDAQGFTALHWVAQQYCTPGHLEALKYLLQQGANPRVVDQLGRTPLDLATTARCTAKVEVIADFLAKHPAPAPPKP